MTLLLLTWTSPSQRYLLSLVVVTLPLLRPGDVPQGPHGGPATSFKAEQ